MKHLCIIGLVLVCVVPAFLWPLEELLHPLPTSLAEEGFEVAGRHRSARSTQSTTASSRKSANKNGAAEKRKGSASAAAAAVHHEATHSPAHPQPNKNAKKPKLNRPTKPGKKYERRHHQQKKHKNPTETKTKQPEKVTTKPHAKHEKDKKPTL